MNYSKYSTRSRDSHPFKNTSIFEIKSFLGRLFINRFPPKLNKDLQYLNLGCGNLFIKDWVNADFYTGFNIFKKVRKPDWMLDLRYSLKCKDNYWDGIFTEHTLEHLTPYQVLSLLKECFRILKPNCWIRISLPDLKKHIEYYLNPDKADPQFHHRGQGAMAISCLTQDWGHQSVWDSELLNEMLTEAGFNNIQERSFGTGTDKKIIIDLKEREFESFYFEAQAIKS